MNENMNGHKWMHGQLMHEGTKMMRLGQMLVKCPGAACVTVWHSAIKTGNVNMS